MSTKSKRLVLREASLTNKRKHILLIKTQKPERVGFVIYLISRYRSIFVCNKLLTAINVNP